MFNPFPNGTSEIIEDIEVYIPPEGFVPDYYCNTGELIPSEILFAEYEKTEQYWRRPFDQIKYNELRREELKLQKQNQEYVNEDLEEIRLSEWRRRLNGVWFYNNGVPTYIPGCYYFYITHWKLDIGYSKFRSPDRNKGLFWMYCKQDPQSLGMLEVTVRRFGKSYFAGCMAFEYVSRQRFKKAGIQSKTDADARDSVYLNSIIQPFKHIVDFFKPISDAEKGSAPKKELSFSKTITKDVDERDAFDNELASIIDYKPSDVSAYDGRKLHYYLHDECGKTTLVDVYERHMIVRKCCTDTENGTYIGKMLATTTVEDIENGGEQFEKYWNGSNQRKRNEVTGQTESGLYRYFLPVYKTKHFDKYGFPDEERAKKEVIAMLASYENNAKLYARERRMSPMDETDLFASDGNKNPYNVKVIDDVINYMNQLPDNHREQARMYDIVWDIPDVKAIAVPNPQGKWSISWLPPDSHQNMVYDSKIDGPNRFKPLNNESMQLGCDPVDHGSEAETGTSDAAIAVYRKASTYHEAELFSKNFIADYIHDPDDPEMFYEDHIIGCFFFGAWTLIEKNKAGIIKYFKKRGYLEFVQERPEETFSITHKGGSSEGISAGTYTIGQYVIKSQTYWSQDGHRCRQPRIADCARKFTVKTRTKRDLSVACGWCLLGAEAPYKPKTVSIPIGALFAFREQQNRH